jgi:hypothetical protein
MSNKEFVIKIEGQEPQMVVPVAGKIKTTLEEFCNQLAEIFGLTSKETKS